MASLCLGFFPYTVGNIFNILPYPKLHFSHSTKENIHRFSETLWSEKNVKENKIVSSAITSNRRKQQCSLRLKTTTINKYKQIIFVKCSSSLSMQH